ncbi:MAG TPA: V-type ATPase subunit [Desulfuromonadaceae bacterium]
MMALMREMPAGGPDDWIVARIRARRALLVDNWDELLLARIPPESLPPAPWRSGSVTGPFGGRRTLQREYAWVFRRMDKPQRRLLLPPFWLAELRTLAICLRRRIGGLAADGEMLRESLLGDRVRRALVEPPDGASAVAALTEVLSPHDSAFGRLPAAFRNGGGAALEGALYDISLEHFAAAATDAAMARYLELLIDRRNLVGLAKHLYWRLAAPPPFLEGGRCAPALLARLFSHGDTGGIAPLVARLGGQCRDAGPGEVERGMLEALGRALRRLGREPEGIGPILDYLWRCARECRNIGLLARLAPAGDADAGDVGDEIVR